MSHAGSRAHYVCVQLCVVAQRPSWQGTPYVYHVRSIHGGAFNWPLIQTNKQTNKQTNYLLGHIWITATWVLWEKIHNTAWFHSHLVKFYYTAPNSLANVSSSAKKISNARTIAQDWITYNCSHKTYPSPLALQTKGFQAAACCLVKSTPCGPRPH